MLIVCEIIGKLVAESVFDLDANNCDVESLVRSDNSNNDSVLVGSKRPSF